MDLEPWALDLILGIGALCCLIMSGIVAGLTLGLMSLDKVGLEIMMKNGGAQGVNAAKIAPIRDQGNLLLVTLLLTNTALNELLPLLVDNLRGISSLAAFFIATISVVFFGEIIPQSICARHGLAIGARMIWLVKILRFLFFPISYPIAYVLDKALGQELGTVYTREELKDLIDLHSREKYGMLTEEETTILKGALDFSGKNVRAIMTPIDDVFMLDADAEIDHALLTLILEKGHSRIPLYEGDRNNVIAVLLVKTLLLLDQANPTPLRNIMSERTCRLPGYVSPDAKLDGVLNYFQSGQTHMLIVRTPAEGQDPALLPSRWLNIGVVTLEDLIEELIQEEIMDETDQYNESHSVSIADSFDKRPSVDSMPECAIVCMEGPPLRASPTGSIRHTPIGFHFHHQNSPHSYTSPTADTELRTFSSGANGSTPFDNAAQLAQLRTRKSLEKKHRLWKAKHGSAFRPLENALTSLKRHHRGEMKAPLLPDSGTNFEDDDVHAPHPIRGRPSDRGTADDADSEATTTDDGASSHAVRTPSGRRVVRPVGSSPSPSATRRMRSSSASPQSFPTADSRKPSKGTANSAINDTIKPCTTGRGIVAVELPARTNLADPAATRLFSFGPVPALPRPPATSPQHSVRSPSPFATPSLQQSPPRAESGPPFVMVPLATNSAGQHQQSPMLSRHDTAPPVLSGTPLTPSSGPATPSFAAPVTPTSAASSPARLYAPPLLPQSAGAPPQGSSTASAVPQSPSSFFPALSPGPLAGPATPPSFFSTNGAESSEIPVHSSGTATLQSQSFATTPAHHWLPEPVPCAAPASNPVPSPQWESQVHEPTSLSDSPTHSLLQHEPAHPLFPRSESHELLSQTAQTASVDPKAAVSNRSAPAEPAALSQTSVLNEPFSPQWTHDTAENGTSRQS